MGQLLAHSFVPPKHHADQDVYAYMVTSFVDAIRQCFKDGGFAAEHNEQEEGGSFLVEYEGRLFEISSDYQVGENADGFAACGCGSQVALGVLYASDGVPAQDRVRAALTAAEKFRPVFVDRLSLSS